MKKLVLFFFNTLKSVHLKKDVGLFPVFFRMNYFENVELLCFKKDSDVPEEFRGVTVKLLTDEKFKDSNSRFSDYCSNLRKNKIIKQYLKKNRDVSHVMIFHGTLEHLFLVRSIKKDFPNLKTYIKFDSDLDSCEYFISKKNKIFSLIRNICIPYVDLFSIESELGLKLLKKQRKICNKVFYVPNGYDDNLLTDFELNKKKKQIITVGRLGTNQKNTELFLDIISKLNLKDWNVKLIGPIEESFKKRIEDFYKSNSNLKDKLVFTGVISDEKEMVRLYQESSVFMLTSRAEGSALVLIESAINGCYILSTDVGAIQQISSNENFCFIAPNSSQKEQNIEELRQIFAKRLQEIIDGDDSFEKITKQVAYCKENFLMSNIIQLPCFKEWVEV